MNESEHFDFESEVPFYDSNYFEHDKAKEQIGLKYLKTKYRNPKDVEHIDLKSENHNYMRGILSDSSLMDKPTINDSKHLKISNEIINKRLYSGRSAIEPEHAEACLADRTPDFQVGPNYPRMRKVIDHKMDKRLIFNPDNFMQANPYYLDPSVIEKLKSESNQQFKKRYTNFDDSLQGVLTKWFHTKSNNSRHNVILTMPNVGANDLRNEPKDLNVEVDKLVQFGNNSIGSMAFSESMLSKIVPLLLNREDQISLKHDSQGSHILQDSMNNKALKQSERKIIKQAVGELKHGFNVNSTSREDLIRPHCDIKLKARKDEIIDTQFAESVKATIKKVSDFRLANIHDRSAKVVHENLANFNESVKSLNKKVNEKRVSRKQGFTDKSIFGESHMSINYKQAFTNISEMKLQKDLNQSRNFMEIKDFNHIPVSMKPTKLNYLKELNQHKKNTDPVKYGKPEFEGRPVKHSPDRHSAALYQMGNKSTL
jgi:hypothetical protein